MIAKAKSVNAVHVEKYVIAKIVNVVNVAKHANVKKEAKGLASKLTKTYNQNSIPSHRQNTRSFIYLHYTW